MNSPTTTSPDRRAHHRSSVSLLAVVAALCVSLAGVAVPSRAVGPNVGLVVIGTMPFEPQWPAVPPPGLLVDDILHKGFVGDLTAGQLFIYDLVGLKLEQIVRIPDEVRLRGNDGRAFAAIDPKGHRIFWTLRANLGAGTCDLSPIAVLSTTSLQWEVRTLPCPTPSVPDAFIINGLSYDEAADKLHLVGMPQSANLVYGTGLQLPKQPTLFAQLDPDTFTFDWTVDASGACDWHTNGQHPATVSLAGDRVVGFCHQGGRNLGARGAAVTIPLRDGAPVVTDGQAHVTADPTYTDPGVLRLVDPATGRLLLISSNLPFGPAVWVFDTQNSWFSGVTPTGADPNKLERFDYGFDRRSGRLYVHSSRGFVVLDARHTPLPGGVTYEVDRELRTDGETAAVMPIDGGLRRVFRVDPKAKRWVVLEDRSPLPPPNAPPDPDRGTADIPEELGKTDRTYNGGANAYGMHLLNVGGIPAAVHAYDYREDCVHRFLQPESPCLVPVLVSPGNREYFLGQSSTNVGESSGASAFASAGRTAPRDYATDADVRSLGKCYADRVELVYSDARPPLDEACDQAAPLAQTLAVGPLSGFTFGNLEQGTGTRDRPEDDFPIPSSACADEGASPRDPAPETRPAPFARSDVGCKASDGLALASSSLVGLETPGASEGPGIQVGRAWSAVETRLDPERGLVTRAEAVAENVNLGNAVKIGRVRTVAETWAKGRTGTTKAAFVREISDVSTPFFECATSCDHAAAADAITKAFGGMVQARVRDPITLASPRGYTGLVAKDPGLLASDAAINDDDSVAASGLDLIFIHDYSKGAGADGQENSGRSRLIVSLAGVQAESHYGVFPPPASAPPGSQGPGTGADTVVSAAGQEPSPLPRLVSPPPDRQPRGRGPVTVPPRTRLPASIDEAVRLIVNRPGEAFLLAVLLGLLAAPLYLAIRRRLAAAVWRT